MLKNWVKWLLVFTLVAVLGPPALANGFLSLFRQDKSNDWAIDPSDFMSMLEALEGRSSVVQIANFGVMEIVEPPEVIPLPATGESITIANQQIKVPKALPGYGEPQAVMVSAAKIRFTLFTAPINRFLQSLSIRATLPSEINNKPFLLNTAPLIAFTYSNTNLLQPDLVIAVTKPSTLEIPPTVSRDSLQKAILAIPGLPKGLQSQFANVAYNGQILMKPEGIGEPIIIKPGIQGAFTPKSDGFFSQLVPGGSLGGQLPQELNRPLNQTTLINRLWGMRFSADCLIWLEDGLIYMVMGELTPSEAVKIARMIN
ncbi:MAG: hypothetical protein GX058_00030 [Firmicutes bacterium]|nr:hypothetical protein [Bacillota bacterium]